MSQYLTDKVVIVTGAASGFGRLIAEKCAAGGAKVVGMDVNPESLGEVFDGIRAAGFEGSERVADVTDLTQVKAVAEHAVDTYGAIDVIVNNAGVMPLAFFADHERAWEKWHLAIDINIKGVLNGILAVYDTMIAQGRGQVVNISSIYGNAGIEGAGVYSATKAAVDALSDSLRVEAQGKIKVSTIKPTGVLGTNLARLDRQPHRDQRHHRPTRRPVLRQPRQTAGGGASSRTDRCGLDRVLADQPG